MAHVLDVILDGFYLKILMVHSVSLLVTLVEIIIQKLVSVLHVILDIIMLMEPVKDIFDILK